MRPILRLPQDDGANGWAALLPPRVPRPALAGDVTAGWAVLGAGFTGLAAARRLAELGPGDRIVVVDALEVGAGASGRNSGFAIDHAHALSSGDAALETVRAQKRLFLAAIEHLGEMVERHGIRCDWRRDGKYHVAASARGAESVLRPLRAELEALGEEHRWLDADALAGEIGMRRYAAGIYTPGTVLLNPAALVRGLADALPEAVTLCENTPVTALDLGSSIVLHTPGGRVTAPRLILATDAFTPALGFYPRQVLPFVAYASLTRPLSADEQAALGGRKSWGITPANGFVAATIRRTPDQRILFRETLAFRPRLRHGAGLLGSIRARHQARFRDYFPMLAGVALEHTWGGYLGLTRNQDSGFGCVKDNVWAAVGHQGVGITRGTIAGRLIAELAAGADNPLIADFQRIARPANNPPRPLLDIGIRVRSAWEAWKNRHEA